MIVVPLAQEPNQKLDIMLGNQAVSLRVYSREGKTYTDLDAERVPVWRGFVAHDLQPLKRYPYLPFSGQLVFLDLQGEEDPYWQRFGTRFFLVYLTEEETTDIFSERNP